MIKQKYLYQINMEEEKKSKKVACLTTFYEWSKAYSLTSVVEEQLLSLLENGYTPILFVHDNFKDDAKVPTGVEIRKVVPRFQLIDYSGHQDPEPGFQEQVAKIKEAFKSHLKDVDFVFTHDLIFQGWFLPYNVGMREAAKDLPCKWFHWIHSAPSPRPENLVTPHVWRYAKMPNSKLVYMNHYDTLRVAEMYGGQLDDVRVVYNPLDLRSFFNYSPFVSNLIKKYDILSADIVDVYPVSSTRFTGKQVDKLLRVMGNLKKRGKKVRFICPNAHANAQREKSGIDYLIQKGIEFGLSRQDMIFTSYEGKEYEVGVSHEIVRELFTLSNLFIFPTQSENCPLILLEAAASKCLLVLNQSFAPLREFFGENALYFQFGSLTETVSYNNEEVWYEDVAKVIIAELSKNRPINAFNKLRQKFNRDWIFKNQMEPMLNEYDGSIDQAGKL